METDAAEAASEWCAMIERRAESGPERPEKGSVDRQAGHDRRAGAESGPEAVPWAWMRSSRPNEEPRRSTAGAVLRACGSHRARRPVGLASRCQCSIRCSGSRPPRTGGAVVVEPGVESLLAQLYRVVGARVGPFAEDRLGCSARGLPLVRDREGRGRRWLQAEPTAQIAEEVGLVAEPLSVKRRRQMMPRRSSSPAPAQLTRPQ
jgi:hypothetical protein